MRTFVTAVALTLLAASQAFAALGEFDDVVLRGRTGSHGGFLGGGPFVLDYFEDTNHSVNHTTSSTVDGTLLVYCVERAQTINFNTVYDLKALAPANTTGATLTGYAAWAYTQFANTYLTAAAAGAASNAIVDGYQKAIWGGMYQTTAANIATAVPGSATANSVLLSSESPFVNYLTDSDLVAAGVTWGNFLASTWGSTASNGGAAAQAAKMAYTGTVQVMQLQTAGGVGVQDQTFLTVGSLSEEVPEPASLVVWSLLAGGAAGLSVVRRRRPVSRGRWSNDSRSAILAVVAGKSHE